MTGPMDWPEIAKQGTGFLVAALSLQALLWVVRRYILKEDRSDARLEERCKTLEDRIEKSGVAHSAQLAALHESYGKQLAALHEKRADGYRMVTRAAIAQAEVPEAVDRLASSMARANAILTAEVSGMRSAVQAAGIRVTNPQILEPDPRPPSALRGDTGSRSRMDVAPLHPERPSRPELPPKGNPT